MIIELVVSPRYESVRVELAEAQRWSVYATELRRVLEVAIEISGVDALEVDDLLVSELLPEKYSELRNGTKVGREKAIDLAVGMAAGHGPYCRLSETKKLRIASGWDGAIHLYAMPDVASNLTELRSQELTIQRRMATPEPANTAKVVSAAADEKFWEAVQEAADRVTLLCERWAYGAYGCKWFLVTQKNVAEVAQVVQPRSLICVVIDPELALDPDLLDDDFTAFKAPLVPGILTYRSYAGGADDLTEVTSEGFSFMLDESVLVEWCAVVPDTDGVVRGLWEDFKER